MVASNDTINLQLISRREKLHLSALVSSLGSRQNVAFHLGHCIRESCAGHIPASTEGKIDPPRAAEPSPDDGLPLPGAAEIEPEWVCRWPDRNGVDGEAFHASP